MGNSIKNIQMRYSIFSLVVLVTAFSSCSTTRTIPDSDPKMVGKYEQPCPDMPEFIDPRDSTVYKAIQIGDQCWMKENLKWLPSVSHPNEDSHIYPHYYIYGYYGNNLDKAKSLDNFNAYGVLYNWAAALNACPPGWKLPNEEDIFSLIENMIDNYEEIHAENAANHLMSAKKVGSLFGDGFDTHAHPRWSRRVNQNGVDSFGFSILPGGMFNSREVFLENGRFCAVGHIATLWTTAEPSTPKALAFFIPLTTTCKPLCVGHKSFAYSVRCLKIEDWTNVKTESDYIFATDDYNDWRVRFNEFESNYNRSYNLYTIGVGVGLGTALAMRLSSEAPSEIVIASLSVSLVSGIASVINRIKRTRKLNALQSEIEDKNWFATPK